MERLQKLLKALIDSIVAYHELKCDGEIRSKVVLTEEEHATDLIKRDAEDLDDVYVGISIQMDDFKTSDLPELIAKIEAKDAKRIPLLHYLLHYVEMIKPLIFNPVCIEKKNMEEMQEQIVQLFLMMQQLIKTKTPVVVHYNHQEVVILGFLNEMIDGGGLCKSGTIIQDKLFSALFSHISPPDSVSEAHIRQTIRDIFREQQALVIEQKMAVLSSANQALQNELTNICSVGVPKMSNFGFNLGWGRIGFWPNKDGNSVFSPRLKQNNSEKDFESDSENEHDGVNYGDISLDRL